MIERVKLDIKPNVEVRAHWHHMSLTSVRAK
jgi:hypothetical protein